MATELPTQPGPDPDTTARLAGEATHVRMVADSTEVEVIVPLEDQ